MGAMRTSIYPSSASLSLDIPTRCCGRRKFQGRFRLYPRSKVDSALRSTAIFLSASSNAKDPQELWSYLVRQEAVDASRTLCGTKDLPAQVVADCFMYKLGMCCTGRHSMDYDLSTHGASYWVCDGAIRQGVSSSDDDADVSWRAAEALQGELPLDIDYH
jgi:hypothetical protein